MAMKKHKTPKNHKRAAIRPKRDAKQSQQDAKQP